MYRQSYIFFAFIQIFVCISFDYFLISQNLFSQTKTFLKFRDASLKLCDASLKFRDASLKLCDASLKFRDVSLKKG